MADPVPRSVRWFQERMGNAKTKRAWRKIFFGFLRRVAAEGGRCVGDDPLTFEWPNGVRFCIEYVGDGRHINTQVSGGAAAPLARLHDGTEVPPAFVPGEVCACRSCGGQFEQGAKGSRTHVIDYEAAQGGRMPLAAHQCVDCASVEGEAESEHGSRAYLDARVERILAEYGSAVRH